MKKCVLWFLLLLGFLALATLLDSPTPRMTGKFSNQQEVSLATEGLEAPANAAFLAP